MKTPGSDHTPQGDQATPEGLYLRRREFLKDTLLFTATSVGVGAGLLGLVKGKRSDAPAAEPIGASGLELAARVDDAPGETRTPYRDVTSYNNFYEFGVDKDDPAANAHTLRTRPWTLTIDGEVARPEVLDVVDERAVGAPPVGDDPSPPAPLDDGVLARDGGLLEPDLRRAVAAEEGAVGLDQDRVPLRGMEEEGHG